MDISTSSHFMKTRVSHVLIISSPYDSFVIEEDGGLTEQIQFHYLEYRLINSPRLINAKTISEALEILEAGEEVDMIITVHQFYDEKDIRSSITRLREKTDRPIIPVCQSPLFEDAECFYHENKRVIPFIWTGEAKLILSLIKMVEDEFNVDDDVKQGVRVIILVEDNPLYISEHLSVVYDSILHHSAKLLKKVSGSASTRISRKRTRPKLLVATTYEEAETLFERFGQSVLACFSDVVIPKGGVQTDCGFQLWERYGQKSIAFVFISSESDGRSRARNYHCAFVKKGDSRLSLKIDEFFTNHLGFGDFVFRMPTGQEVGRARNANEFLSLLSKMPPESIMFHAKGNHFSNWFQARGEYSLAMALRKSTPQMVAEAVVDLLGKKIVEFRSKTYRGYIFEFEKYLEMAQYKRKEPLRMFCRMTVSNQAGSLGGKARGLLFMERVMAQRGLFNVSGFKILTPFTLVLSTQVFEDFMMFNHQLLGHVAESSSDLSDGEISQLFLNASFNDDIYRNLRRFLKEYKVPLAVRSSSIMEDSRKRPLAGVYQTFFLPNSSKNFGVRCQQLYKAIKLVYASQFLGGARRYLSSVGANIGLEKMGCIIQEVVGRVWRDGRFYPQVSGVAQSYNYYALKGMDPSDGIAYVALGLGKAVVDMGMGIKFGLGAPQAPYLHQNEYFVHGQKQFYAIDLKNTEVEPTSDEMFSLTENTLTIAERDGSLHALGSVWDDNGLSDYIKGDPRRNPRLITFRSILQRETFEIAKVISAILTHAETGLSSPAEIEFAFNLNPKECYLLQMRPLPSPMESLKVVDDVEELAGENLICKCTMTTSHGVFRNFSHVVYVRRENFDKMRTMEIKAAFEKVNRIFKADKLRYIAVGIGRWGTREKTLGIPIEFSGISNAGVIVELTVPEFRVDPTFGTHFIHNVMALGIPFLANVGRDDYFNWDWTNDLSDKDVIYETDLVRAVRLKNYSLECLVNGAKRVGVIRKQSENVQKE